MEFLESISFIAKSTEVLLSIDCFLKDNNISTHPVFAKMILACILPVGLVFFFSVLWLLLGLLLIRVNSLKNLIVTVIVLVFITLPSITSITFGIYNCIDIFGDGDTYLAADMSVACWTG